VFNRDRSLRLSAHRPLRSNPPHTLDALESRRVLSAAAVPAIVDGILYISGTPRADEISVAVGRNGRVHACVNRVTTQFKLGKVHGVVIDAGAGADRAGVAIAVPAFILGGAGNDTLVSSSGDDYLSGGKGIDQLFADTGNDQIEGGEGTPTKDPVINGLAFSDMLTLAANYNSSGGTGSNGGSGSEGSVNFDDLLALNESYRRTLGSQWELAQFAEPTISADVSSVVAAQRVALVVLDKYVVRSQADAGNRRMRVDFALTSSPNATAFSIVMRTKSLIVFAEQSEVVRVVGFDSRTLAKKLPATGTAFVVGKSKAIRLAGNLTDMPGQNAVTLRAVGGSIVVSRNSEEGATFVAA
jgi:hypothetical protein